MNTISKSLLLSLSVAAAASGQTPVSGVVYDSVARAPLANATVQLVRADNQTQPALTSVSDTLGRFAFSAVPSGRYTVGFLHPMLDSLGIEPPAKDVTISGARTLRIDLAIPSATRMRAAVCGDSAGSGGAIAGVVRDATERGPFAGVRIEARWLEVTIRTGTTDRHFASRVATSNENGWYRLCDVPKTGTVALVASRERDSTDVMEIQMPDGGFARGDLYLGKASYVAYDVVNDSVKNDTLPRRSRRVGDGRLTGTVLTFPERRPLSQARIRIVGGPEVSSNDRGEWTLSDIPTGTRTLEVRMLGYYPEQRSVNVVPNAPRVRVELPTMKAMLDTVRIRAIRLFDPAAADFAKRQRTLGYGRFLTPQDIERSGGFWLSDVFRMLPGMRVERAAFNEPMILMRSIFGGMCQPAIFLDGSNIPGLTAGDVDGIINRENVIGIEIYSEPVPPQFQIPMSGCGSIVIWTDRTGLMAKSNAHRRKPATLKTGLFFVGAALAIFLITK